MKKSLYILLISIVGLFACEETIELDLDQVETLYVIEGLVTNEMRQHEIKISSTLDFYSDSEVPKVSTATVIVSDDLGQSWNFPSVSGEPGVYRSEEAFAGEIGRTYSLEVTLEGQTFTASDELRRVTTIDSITWRIDEEEMEDPEEEGEFYEILIYTKEPQETVDYYLFKFYQNDTILNFDNTEIFFADDELIGENIDGIEGAEYYRLGDVARFEMYSISRNAFVYYSDLYSVMQNDGGMFGPVPANPRTNIQGGALGLFQVSALESEELVIGE